MNQKDIVISIKVALYDELGEADRHLVDEARAATLRAYAPYSNFRVGAAVLLDNGEVLSGSNQENAAYPSGLCAERTTAFYAHSRYPDARFETVAIAARDTSGNEIMSPISPCGACRQSLLEFETLARHDVRVLLVGAEEIYILPSVKSLLPLSFSEIV